MTSRVAWRSWLTENHKTMRCVWLTLFRKSAGVASVTYEEAVEEALCFGWIDATVRKLNDASYVQYFSVRKPKSVWSAVNRARVERLEAAGLMTAAGRAAIDLAKRSGSWTALQAAERLDVPEDLQLALEALPRALGHWTAFPKSAKQNILYWISSAKRAGAVMGASSVVRALLIHLSPPFHPPVIVCVLLLLFEQKRASEGCRRQHALPTLTFVRTSRRARVAAEAGPLMARVPGRRRAAVATGRRRAAVATLARRRRWVHHVLQSQPRSVLRWMVHPSQPRRRQRGGVVCETVYCVRDPASCRVLIEYIPHRVYVCGLHSAGPTRSGPFR